MNDDFYTVPPRQPRGWWDMIGDRLICSECGGVADPSDLTRCRQCSAVMTVDEKWTRTILERGYQKNGRNPE